MLIPSINDANIKKKMQGKESNKCNECGKPLAGFLRACKRMTRNCPKGFCNTTCYDNFYRKMSFLKNKGFSEEDVYYTLIAYNSNLDKRAVAS